MSIRSISFSAYFNNIHHFPTLISASFSVLVLLAKIALELGQCLYLISCSDSNRFTTLQGNLTTRHMGTQRVPHGNLSLAHTEVITVASYPRILSSLTCARLRAGRFQHAHILALKKGEIHPVRHTALPTRRSCRLHRFTMPHKH